MGSQPPKPSDTTLLAQAQEFVSVPEGPRALLGHSSKKAAEESGVGCDISLCITMHLGSIFTSSLPFPNPVPPLIDKGQPGLQGVLPRDRAPVLPQPPTVSLLGRHFPSLGFSFSICKMGGMIAKILSISQTLHKPA